MNKVLICMIFFALNFTSCRSQIKTPIINNRFSVDSVVYWRSDNIKNQAIQMSPISVVKRDFKLQKGKLYNIKRQEIVSNIELVLIVGDSKGKDVKIVDGLPNAGYCDFTDGVTCRMDIHYDNTGNMDGYFSVQDYETTFIKGKGYWKNYYLHKNNTLKEEGEVRNNFKFGEWKYYNKEGNIDSTKIYSIKDSVDVRFPHCIFNKTEPCY